MTKNEALKAAIDGKKVRPKIQAEHLQFIFFNPQKNHFMTMWDSGEEPSKVNCWTECLWEIVPEYVDFAEAWKAYENGKAIQSYCAAKYAKNMEFSSSFGKQVIEFTTEEIRAQWLILEDN